MYRITAVSRRGFALMVMLGCVVLTSGCSVSDRSRAFHHSRPVPDDLLSSIVVGQTTERQVQEVLGPPDSWDLAAQRAVYYLANQTQHRTRVLLFLGYSKTGMEFSQLDIYYQQGVVSDFSMNPGSADSEGAYSLPAEKHRRY